MIDDPEGLELFKRLDAYALRLLNEAESDKKEPSEGASASEPIRFGERIRLLDSLIKYLERRQDQVPAEAQEAPIIDRFVANLGNGKARGRGSRTRPA